MASSQLYLGAKMTSTGIEGPTRGQIERTLSQQLQKLYREHLGHSTGKVTCQLVKDKLTIVIEDALTQPEQLLLQKKDDIDLVKQVRSDLDEVLRPQLISLIEANLDRKVLDLISNTTLETGRTGLIVILAS